MKIGIVGPFPPFRGGIAQFTARLHETLAEYHPEHTFIPVSFKRLYPSFLFPGTSQMEPPGGGLNSPADRLIDSCNPLHWMKVRKFFRESTFDWIIIQWWHPFFTPALLHSIPRGIKTAAICHNVLPHEGFPLGCMLTRKFIRRMDLLVAHSTSDLEIIKSLQPESKTLKLYLPLYNQYLNKTLDRNSVRREFGYEADEHVILFFGLIRPYKGLMDLIEAMKLLPENISLLIAGECYQEKSAILQSINSETLSGRVKWTDEFVPDNDVAKYFLASDVVALPYRHATQSAVAQIALSFGKLLVLTDTGGLSELLVQGSTGFLAEPGSSISISKAIQSAIELSGDLNLQQRIENKASDFSWTAYAQKLMNRLS